MINTSTEYKNLIYTSGRKFHAKARIVLADGTILNITDEDIMQNGITIEDCVSPSNSFQIGSAIINELTLILYNLNEKFNDYNFEKALINIQIGLELSANIIEWIPKGYFTVDEAVFSSSTVTITALDNMYKFDKPYKKSELQYPATLFNILKDVCNCCNVLLSTQRFLNDNYIVETRPQDEKTTFREIVSWISQLSGNFAKIDYNGSLKLFWYDYSNFETNNYALIERIKSYEIAIENITVTGVQIIPINEEETPYLSGEEGYIISIENNPLAQSGIEGLAYSLGQKLNGFTFRPFKAESLSNPAIESGDIVLIKDRKGNSYRSFISSISYIFGSFETYTADAETPNNKESTRFSASTKAIQAAKTEVHKQISIYDLNVQQMSNLMANAMGIYETVEKQDDGSIICYAHDKPTLDESQIIWRKTREAFSVSYDGGQTWHGMTAEGNIVAQVLTVIGINADWIKTGAIKAENISEEYKQSVTDEIETSSEKLTQSFQVADNELLSQISKTYTNSNEFSEYKETVSTQFSQTNKDWTFQFQNITQEFTDFSGETQENFSEITKYIRFVDGNIILGTVDSELILKISNGRISFMENEIEVAYISNGKLYITDGEFISTLQLGKFVFEPRANGNLSFYKNKN